VSEEHVTGPSMCLSAPFSNNSETGGHCFFNIVIRIVKRTVIVNPNVILIVISIFLIHIIPVVILPPIIILIVIPTHILILIPIVIVISTIIHNIIVIAILIVIFVVTETIRITIGIRFAQK
jgi:hypothetical protein